MAPAVRGGGVGQGIGDGGSPRRCDESRMVLFLKTCGKDESL
jgi:hypothetical protein